MISNPVCIDVGHNYERYEVVRDGRTYHVQRTKIGDGEEVWHVKTSREGTWRQRANSQSVAPNGVIGTEVIRAVRRYQEW